MKKFNPLIIPRNYYVEDALNEAINYNFSKIKNLLEVLNAAGSSLEKVIFARVYLVNFGDFDRMNEVYASYFANGKLPARTCIGVTGLAVGASVEIDFVAAC